MRRPGLGTEPSAPSDPLKHEGVVLSCAPFPAERARAFSGRCARTPPWSSPSRPVSPPPLLSCLSALATEALFLPRATPPPGLPRRADPLLSHPRSDPGCPPPPHPAGSFPGPYTDLKHLVIYLMLYCLSPYYGARAHQAWGAGRPRAHHALSSGGWSRKIWGGGGREGSLQITLLKIALMEGEGEPGGKRVGSLTQGGLGTRLLLPQPHSWPCSRENPLLVRRGATRLPLALPLTVVVPSSSPLSPRATPPSGTVPRGTCGPQAHGVRAPREPTPPLRCCGLTLRLHFRSWLLRPWPAITRPHLALSENQLHLGAAPATRAGPPTGACGEKHRTSRFRGSSF